METINYPQNQPEASSVLVNKPIEENFLLVSQEIKSDLITITKWAYFMSIIGFIGIGIMAIGSVSTFFLTGAATEYQDFQNIPFPLYFIGIIYLATAVICFFPNYFMFLYAKKLRKGLDTNNQELLAEGFKNEKKLTVFLGVLVVISLILFVMMIIGLIFSFGMLQALSGGAMV